MFSNLRVETKRKHGFSITRGYTKHCAQHEIAGSLVILLTELIGQLGGQQPHREVIMPHAPQMVPSVPRLTELLSKAP